MTEDERLDAIAASAIAAALTRRWGFVRFRLAYEIAHDAIARARPTPTLAAVLDAERSDPALHARP